LIEPRTLSVVAAALLASACGASRQPAAPAPAPAPVDAGAPDAPDPWAPLPETKVDDRPVAETQEKAMSVIDDVMEARHTRLEHCAEEYAKRKGDPHADLSVLIAFDRDGTLMGVSTRHPDQSDRLAEQCIFAQLHGAPFPRTHTTGMEIEKFFGYGIVYR
jgi:hypothetical protein